MDQGLSVSPARGQLQRLTFTQREAMLLCLIAEGLTTYQAAERLHISRHTAAQHVSDMLRRAQARSRGELIARAYAAGVLATGIWPPRVRARPVGMKGAELEWLPAHHRVAS